MPHRSAIRSILFFSFIISLVFFGCQTQEKNKLKRLVFIAGKKSHGPDTHEYIKTVRLLKAMFEKADNIPQVWIDIVYDGWPEEEYILDNADLILFISDGQDGDLFSPVPYMYPERIAVIQKQIDRGCGFAAIHFSTFAPDDLAPQVLDWVGGYFDWQGENGEREWYSNLTITDTNVAVASQDHPVSNGLPETFQLKDEYYYQIRFKENDPNLVPFLRVPGLKNDLPESDLVAWGVERPNGGRGFGTTMGHFYQNWKDDNFRTFMLNAILWAAGVEVPKEGVNAPFMNDKEVTEALFDKSRKTLILTGNDHPAHDWKAKTEVLKEAFEYDGVHVDISTDIENLQYYNLKDYDFLVQNYCNWEDPKGLSENGQKGLITYLENGGGLLLIHFANGAFHYSLPDAGESDWPGYREICQAVWDHNSDSGHDEYGKMIVGPTPRTHFITRGTRNFETTDELYYNQKTLKERPPLLIARSKITDNLEPLAWAYASGQGRVFQTLLGHSVESLQNIDVQRIILRAGRWAGKDENQE
ncbi:MAG: ThuA domain-containing protein [Bacteroidia bacterium]